MQDQPEIQHVKIWQAPELVELGGVAQGTENGGGFSHDGGTAPTS